MSRNQIDGDQVQDETLTGDNVLDESLDGNDILDGSIQRKDLNTTTPGQAVTRKVVPGVGIDFNSTGTDEGTGDVTINNKSGTFGIDSAHQVKRTPAGQEFTGNQFQQYDIMTFAVSEATNTFRLNIDFIWRHNAASNDIRAQLWLDGSQYGEELRIEPKDAGGDQRNQNAILDYVDNLSVGNHTLELRIRPASGNRVSELFKSVIETWRV